MSEKNSFIGGIFKSISQVGSDIKGLLLDEIINEISVVTPYGTGQFLIQIRQNNNTKENYLLMKITGGDTTLHFRVNQTGASQIHSLIDELTNLNNINGSKL